MASLGTFALPRAADALPAVRVGLLEYGTVNWEMGVIRRQQLDQSAGARIEVVPFAVKEAAAVALQAGAVDAIVTDWIWVARQRAQGRNWVFAPYSRMVGSVMVRPDAGMASVADLRGTRLGIAGGGLDKNWLLLRAYARRQFGVDAADLVRPTFAAPPLLNALMLKGELPAVLNFWHFSARLRAAGMNELISMTSVLQELGLDPDVPLLGWAFDAGWARRAPGAIEGLLRASAAAKAQLRTDDALWLELQALVRAEGATLTALRDGYRAGIPVSGGGRAQESAQAVFEVLATHGGSALVGSLKALPAGLFWSDKAA
jgi:NitT/TauT family transport system substrate-binding protein